jgi:diacylglycerol O-acyltransferase
VHQRPALGQPVSPRDAVNIYCESDRAVANIVDCYVFDTTREPSVGRSHERNIEWMRERLGCAPLLTQRLERAPLDLDFPYWVRTPAFNVADHVTTTVASRPGWEMVRQHISAVLLKRMDLRRPPWEMHVLAGIHGVPGLPESAVVVVLKVHHAATDGTGAARLASRLFSQETFAAPPLPLRRPLPHPARMALNFPLNLARFAVAAAQTYRSGRQIGKERLQLRRRVRMPGLSPATRFDRRISQTPVWETLHFALGDVLHVKDRCPHCTVNDVMLAVVSGAMRRYLEEHGEGPEESLTAVVPMTTRKLRPSPNANQLISLKVDLCTDVDSPRERLSEISASARAAKLIARSSLSKRYRRVAENTPPQLLKLMGKAHASSEHNAKRVASNTVVSNVAHGPAEHTFDGAPIWSTFSLLPPSDGQGLLHYVSSVGNRLTLTITAERKMMPDIDRYCELVREGFNELSRAVQAGS